MTKTFLFSAKLLRFCNVKSLTAKHDRRYGSYKVQRVIFPWYCSIVKSLSMVPRRFQKYLDTIHTESKTALKSHLHLPFRYLEVSWGFLGGRKLPLEVEPTVSKAWGPSQWSPRGALLVHTTHTHTDLFFNPPTSRTNFRTYFTHADAWQHGTPTKRHYKFRTQ